MKVTCIEGREHQTPNALKVIEESEWSGVDEFCRFLETTFPYPAYALKHEAVHRNGRIEFTRKWKGVQSVMVFDISD